MLTRTQLVLVLPILATRLAAQNPPRPAFDSFEVATIKPASPEDQKAARRYIRMQSAHAFQAKNYTVDGLIAAAYDLNPKMISGGPAWAENDRFELIAATPGDLRPTYDDQMRMLRKLLSDRLGLTFHREKKEFSIYELTLAPGGPKFQPTTAMPDEPNNVTSTVYPGENGTVEHIHLPARNVTMQQVASVLQRAILDRPVVDKTALTGRFDFDLDWAPDESQFGGTLPPGPSDTGRPGLFTALQQIGLHIQATRGDVDTLVIDHLDRPSDN